MALSIRDFASVAVKDGFIKSNTFGEGLTRYSEKPAFGKLGAWIVGPSEKNLKSLKTEFLNAMKSEYGDKIGDTVEKAIMTGDSKKPLSASTVRQLILDAEVARTKETPVESIAISKLKLHMDVGAGKDLSIAAAKKNLLPDETAQYIKLGEKAQVGQGTVAVAIEKNVSKESFVELGKLPMSERTFQSAMRSGIDAPVLVEHSKHNMSYDYAIKSISVGVDYAVMTDILGKAQIPPGEFDSYIGLYSAKNLVISDSTVVRNLTDANLNKIDFLGAGNFNAVFKVEYKTSDNQPREVGVFKPLVTPDLTGKTNVERGMVAFSIGIDTSDPQLAMRNIATYDVAKELGFDVVPKVEIGAHLPPKVIYTEPEDIEKHKNDPEPTLQLGIVMDLAKGVPGSEVSSKILAKPETCRELVKLQLLDAIVGQGDRHHNNYLIHFDKLSGKVTVTGIDNDQCFGKNTKHPDELAQKSHDVHGYRGVELPLHMDTEMVTAIRNLTNEKLDQMLGGKLSPDEISAAKSRLNAVKDHIVKLEKFGQIIDPKDWGRNSVMQTMRMHSDCSYFGRENEAQLKLGL